MFLTHKFLNGPWIRLIHIGDSCYTFNTHNNLVALWAKSSLGNLGKTEDKISQYLLPAGSRIMSSKFVASWLYGNLLIISQVIDRVNIIDNLFTKLMERNVE